MITHSPVSLGFSSVAEDKIVSVVTGGAGVIGSHLCDALLRSGRQVCCIDNFRSGSRENIRHLVEQPDFKLVELDIISRPQMEGRVDEIYNLACPASPPHYQKDPVHTLKTSIIGTLNMLEMAKSKGARFLQASTSEIYGDALVHPQAESYLGNVNCYGPRACYDEGKRAAETLTYDFSVQYNVSTRIARIFNTYGPRMLAEDGRVISNFVVQALCGEPITVYGDGSQTRSFCHISDTVRGLVALMNANGDKIDPVNIGNPDEHTIADIADLIVKMTNSSSIIIRKPLPVDDPRQRRPDISRAYSLLGWQPHVKLHDGLVETIDYFRQVLKHTRIAAIA